MPLLGVSRRRAAALGPPSSLEDDDPVPCRPHVALTLRQAEIDGAGHRGRIHLNPTRAALNRLPGIPGSLEPVTTSPCQP